MENRNTTSPDKQTHQLPIRTAHLHHSLLIPPLPPGSFALQVLCRLTSRIPSLSDNILEQYRSTHDAKPRRWTIERAAEFFDVVREDVEVDYYLFVELLLSYPRLRSCLLIREQGQRFGVVGCFSPEASSLAPSLLTQGLRALSALPAWQYGLGLQSALLLNPSRSFPYCMGFNYK
ncbi:hypothetical protein HO173_011428 [Letharia columbiana]|uniref:Uncharacterized protein n=1 Tax=Letharia columbiana TaxID=112416 RepID=A0A8H6KZ42_9LECA|nr:uncharacterized protein HO173_011428 [Letharia columbiana]KAF6229573.1 hypothetical protein HO173_011428 [Letharia columbiana]